MADIKADCMTVRIGKTAKTTEKVLEFVMTPELEDALAECKAIKPLSIYLFHNKRGQSYLADDRSYEGFSNYSTDEQREQIKNEKFDLQGCG